MNTNVIEPMTAEGMGTEKQESGITYTFRKLNATDTFLMFKILGKIGISEFSNVFGKDSVKDLIASVQGAENATTVIGISVIFELANVIISNLPKCETEVYQMLSNVSNLTVDEVKTLDFAIFVEMVIDFIKKEEFKDFIKVVSKSFKLEN